MYADQSHQTRHNPPDLFDYGRIATETRAAASVNARPRQSARQSKIYDWIKSRGRRGATRHEIAANFRWPLSGVCSPCLELLRSGQCREVAKRESPFGRAAAVIIATDCEVAL